MRYRTTNAADEDIIEIYVHGKEQFGAQHAEAYAEGLFRLSIFSPAIRNWHASASS